VLFPFNVAQDSASLQHRSLSVPSSQILASLSHALLNHPLSSHIFHIFGALAEFERDIIRERTQAGLQAARARGRTGGRPKSTTLNTPKKVILAQSLYDDKNNTIDEICKTLNISRATLYRYIKVK
jgi:DNA invertase Pin-like site-specific DNA recombinase